MWVRPEIPVVRAGIRGQDVPLGHHRHAPALDLHPQGVPVKEALELYQGHRVVLEVVKDHGLLPRVAVPPLALRRLPEGVGPTGCYETALRQTRWQKVIYPNKITRKLTIGFKPYTLVACQGPSTVQNAQWSRVWECNRWMPFNWANTSQYDLNPSGVTGSLYMYGPYLVPNAPSGGAPGVKGTIYGTMTIYLQFRGQR